MDLPLEITNSVVLYRAHKEIPKGPKKKTFAAKKISIWLARWQQSVSQCFKLAEKVSFNIASEASYVYKNS